MSKASVRQMSDRIGQLMAERFGGPAGELAQILPRHRRKLPEDIHAAAEHLAHSAELARTTHAGRLPDYASAVEAYDKCLHYLTQPRRADRFRLHLPQFGTGTRILVNLAILAALVAAFLWWRGLYPR